MKNLNIFKRSLTLSMILLMVLNSMVLADNLIPDGDNVAPIGSNSLNLGEICQGENKSGNVLFSISRQGSGNVFANSATVTISVNEVSNNASATMIEGIINLPTNWVSLGNNTLSEDTASSLVTITTIGLEIGDFSQSVKFVASGAENGGGGTVLTRPGTLLVIGEVVDCQSSDDTPPVINFEIDGTLGNNGWYTNDVTVIWDVEDLESVFTSSEGCKQTKIDYDTTGVTLTCEATSAGGTTEKSVTIKRDATAPEVSLVGGPADGGSYYFGSVPAAPTCTAIDSLSGPNGCVVTEYGATKGSHTLTATAYDVAGNKTVKTRSYTVLAWTLNGFYKPVDMGVDVWNTVKGGSTVPLKFEVFAGSTEFSEVSVVKSFNTSIVKCDAADEEAPIEITSTGGTSLRYDSVAGQFIQNWQTPKSPGSCYRVTMTTQDGSSLVAFFKLK